MVRLDRIYTGGGDTGETSLGDGTRVAKDDIRVDAMGEVDEANAAIGLARLHAVDGGTDGMLARVQNDLFDLGADLSRPAAKGDDGNLRITATQCSRLEAEIDAVNAELAPLDSFVLRGGNALAAHLHFACTIVRRAERRLASLAAASVNPLALVYLNRLSDLLFVLARQANDGGAADVTWRPGGNADT